MRDILRNLNEIKLSFSLCSLSLSGLAGEVEETVTGEIIFCIWTSHFMFWLPNLGFLFF